jgi:nicotinamide phosphoribosyltransferase
MSTFEDAALSGAGHLLSFVGTDTIPAIDLLEEYYGANVETELVGCSVPATEHSCMCMGSKENELETFRRLIEDIYPTGIVSIVSDTWDFWKVITEYSVMLKDKILNRNGKTVYRPDSGDPVKIICGDQDANPETPAFKGAMQILWDIFGGTINDKGYKVLDSHVGLIYGDSITFERAKQILQGLVKQGFASTNIVFGIGSYTYQYVTRDTFGFAVKSTYGEIDGIGQDIFKDPITDNGTKKSAKGRLAVINDNGLKLIDQLNEPLSNDLLEIVFENSKLIREHSLSEIRARLNL